MAQWITAVCCAVGGVLVGVVARLVLSRLARHATTTAWSWDDLAWDALRHLAVPLAVSTGLWWASQALHLRSSLRTMTDKVLLIILILAASLAAARFAGRAVREIALSRSGVAQSASIFVNITRIIVLIIGVLVLLQSLGVSVTPLVTALGVGGLAVALALQDTLANLFAGIHILASKKVQTGDYIKLASGEDGYIVDINWRNTTIRQLSGNMVIVPNSRFADAIMTNYHHTQQDMSVMVTVGVSYDSDLEMVERVTSEVGAEVMATVDGAVRDYQPFIRYNTFADSSIKFTVLLRVGEYSAQYLVVHEFIKRLHARYRVEGIEIPFPTSVVVSGSTSPRPDFDDPLERSAALV
jgi:small-conductance mechanosensitive channel